MSKGEGSRETRGFFDNINRLKKFNKLRQGVLQQIKKNTSVRINRDPHPNDEEYRLGAFFEMFEPQVLNAVRELNRKGYATQSSGFNGKNGELQTIDGNFSRIDKSTMSSLSDMGVEFIPHVGWIRIQFAPESPDLNLIKSKWSQIVTVFPDLGVQVDPIQSLAAIEFRKKYPK